MARGFDYSKWDKLELSDDEDTHPGAKFIEEQTLRRDRASAPRGSAAQEAAGAAACAWRRAG